MDFDTRYTDTYTDIFEFHKGYIKADIDIHGLIKKHEANRLFAGFMSCIMIENDHHKPTMAELSKGGIYFVIYQQIFQFHQKHARPQSDADWQQMAADLDVLNKRYPGDKFVVNMLDKVIEEIERASK